MKITMYELLGMVKDGKTPKKIKYDNIIFEYDGIYYMAKHTYLDEYCDLSRVLNDEVEILEEKKIPEKIEIYEDEEGHYFIDKHCKKIYITCDEVNFMVEEFNQLIDYLKSKGE